MIMDQNLLFDSAAAITATAPSTNVVDLAVARDLGVGDPDIDIVAIVGTAFTAAGAATLQIQVQGSTDNSTWDTYVQSDAIPKAALTAGAKFHVDLPPVPPGKSKPRYLRLNYVVATGPMTAGTMTAFALLDDHLATGQAIYGYPPGIVIAN